MSKRLTIGFLDRTSKLNENTSLCKYRHLFKNGKYRLSIILYPNRFDIVVEELYRYIWFIRYCDRFSYDEISKLHTICVSALSKFDYIIPFKEDTAFDVDYGDIPKEVLWYFCETRPLKYIIEDIEQSLK